MVEHQREERLDNIFRALADPTRREMVRRLAGRERTVTELAAPFQMSLAAASKHIKVLEEAGLLRRAVRGRMHMLSLDPEALKLAHAWIRFYEQLWSDQLDALERFLERQDAESD